MGAYILGMGKICPDEKDGTDFKRCIEPDYSQWIDAKQMRRLSRILKMSIASASIALDASGKTEMDGVIVGTGLGCLEDTQSFLSKMIEQNEFALNPTPFIQSTHNTIAGTIALIKGYRGYNQTYTQNFLSFEQALMDALMLLQDDPSRTFLVGGADELIPALKVISDRIQAGIGNTDKIALGEGAGFMVLSGELPSVSCVEIIDITTIYHALPEEIEQKLLDFLRESQVDSNQITLLGVGSIGLMEYDQVLVQMLERLFPGAEKIPFKNQCGEYPGAGGFGIMELGDRLLKNHKTGDEYALSVNFTLNKYFSFTLMKSCHVTG